MEDFEWAKDIKASIAMKPNTDYFIECGCGFDDSGSAIANGSWCTDLNGLSDSFPGPDSNVDRGHLSSRFAWLDCWDSNERSITVVSLRICRELAVKCCGIGWPGLMCFPGIDRAKG